METRKTEISVSQFIQADAEHLFDCWLDPDKIKTWIFPSSGDTIKSLKTDPAIGGTFSFVIERDTATIEHIGEYLAIEKPDRLVFTWAVADEEGSDRVELTFTPKESGTEATLTIELHPDWIEYAEPTKKAWTSMLESLKKTAENHPEARASMLIRKPVEEVFEALVNPEITSKFWFTKGSSRLEEGKEVTWEWEQFGVSGTVAVTGIRKNERIRFKWEAEEEGAFRTVEILFEPRSPDTTFVSAVESGFKKDDSQLVEKISGQTEGWTLVLSNMKAWLEFGIELNLIADHNPN